MYYNDAAKEANKKISDERLMYQSTTAPLMKINNTLDEIKNLLKEILEILAQDKNGTDNT